MLNDDTGEINWDEFGFRPCRVSLPILKFIFLHLIGTSRSELTRKIVYGFLSKVAMKKKHSSQVISCRHPKSLLRVLTVLVGSGWLFGLSGCSKQMAPSEARTSTQPAATETQTASSVAQGQSGEVPASLANLGEYGENIYDAAKAKQWTEARAKLSALKAAIQQSDAELSKTSADKRQQLQGMVTSLDASISQRQQEVTMRESNQVTLMSSALAAAYHPKVPADVARLDYDGRELEIWSRAKNMAKLKATAQDVRQTWDRLKPEVQSHNGAAEAQKFGQLVAEADKAVSVAQYQRLAGPVLDEVDNLEKVFESS